MPHCRIETIVKVKNGITYWESEILCLVAWWNPFTKSRTYFLHTSISDGACKTTLRGGSPYPDPLKGVVYELENKIKEMVSESEK